MNYRQTDRQIDIKTNRKTDNRKSKRDINHVKEHEKLGDKGKTEGASNQKMCV